MENSRSFSGNTVGNSAIVNQGNGNHITVNADNSNADKLFLQEISKTDPVYDKKRILMLKGPLLRESFSWILKHEEVNKWRHTKESGVLWIKGDPGKGKTMLLCGIIEDLEQKLQSENLSYFFCQAADYRINTAAAVVGGLIKMLLRRHPALLSRIRESHGDGPKGQLDGTNALVILCDIFETITNDSSLTNVICVVDALDECVTDCRYLLNLIIKTRNRVKWLLSSRNEKGIEKRLDQVPQRLVLELKQNAKQISMSIDAYIRHHVQKMDALTDDEWLQIKTLNILKSKAQGSFLWVALVIEQLHDTDHWKVEEVLEQVPEDLENLYGLILDRTEKMEHQDREACQVLLSIVSTAKRPLHLEELLIFINSHWMKSKYCKTHYSLRDTRDMAKACGSILSIREDTIYFIHQSAKDYVVDNATHRIFPILYQHYKMFETSLNAMSNVLEYDIYCLKDPGIHIDEVPPRDGSADPLASIRYCCVFWVEHLVSGYQYEGFEHDEYLKDDGRLYSFLKEKFLCWIESLALIRSFYPQAQIALQKLRDLITSYCGNGGIENESSQAARFRRQSEIHELRRFTDDAYRFVENSKEFVAHWPLQLYFSAINFGQDDCTIRKTFGEAVCEKFGPSPIRASAPDSSSIELQQTENVFDIVTISPDSRFVASRHAYNGDIYVRRGDDCQLVYVLKAEIPEHDSPFYPLIFSPDSQLLAYAVSSGVQIWCAITGDSFCLLRHQNSRRFSSLAFSSDPKHLVAGDFIGGIYIWRIDSGQLIQKYELGHEFREPMGLLMTSISPDSAYVAAFWSLVRVRGRIWHLHTDKSVVAGADQSRQGKYTPLDVAGKAQIYFSSDSTILVCVTESRAQIFDVITGASLQSFALDGNEHLRLLSFDPINSRILTIKSAFLKTSSWKDWQKSPRLGYSYDYRLGDSLDKQGMWILQNGKNHCYVPNNFRPGKLDWPRDTTNVAITDSLLAILNQMGEVVIIKLPPPPEGTTTSIGTFDVGQTLQDMAGSAGNFDSVAQTSATSDYGLRSPKRKRSISDESNARDQIIRLNAQGEQESMVVERE